MRQSKQLIPVVASTSARDKGKSKGNALIGPKHAAAVPGTASGTGSLVGRVKNGVEAAKRGDEPSAGMSKSSLLRLLHCYKHRDGCNDCSVAHCSVQANHCSAYKTCESPAPVCFMRNALMYAQLSVSPCAFYPEHLHNVEYVSTVPRRFSVYISSVGMRFLSQNGRFGIEKSTLSV